jgi:xylulokinase
VKALIVTDEGIVVGRGQAGYKINRPQKGYAEQFPNDWIRATVTAVQEALHVVGSGKPNIMAIGLSGQMHGTICLNASKEVLYPAIIWPDSRSSQQVSELTQQIGLERLIQICGSPLATGFQAASVLWLQQNKPSIWKQTRYVLTPKSYLLWRLTGVFAADPSDGSGTLLLDVRNRNWAPEILTKLSLDREMLPTISESGTVIGELLTKTARLLGLPEKVKVVAGAADTACSLLGSGVTGKQSLLVTISTGGQIILPAEKVQIDPLGRIHTFCSSLEPGLEEAAWYQMAAVLSAGMSVAWLKDNIFKANTEVTFDEMTTMAAATEPGAGGLIFLPYLAGERTPHMNPDARGILLGLNAGHSRGHLVRAVMEGVALACYDAYSILQDIGGRPKTIVMGGGGAKSSLWQQILADVFNLPVRQILIGEQSAVGACILAGAGIGELDPLETSRRWVSYGPVVEPIAANLPLYQAILNIFRSTYQKHVDDFKKLRQI